MQSVLQKIRNIFSSKLRLLFFFVFLLVLAGIVFLTKTTTEMIRPLDIFSRTSSEEIKKTPVIYYPSQEITIETPFADPTTIIREPIFPDHVCSLADYGAVPDGKTMNTEAFEKAIDACVSLGGGKVNVPAGIWLTGPIHLRSNIELHIERDATILFSTHTKDYLPVVFSRFEGIEYYNYSPPIYALDATNVAITGVGTLDGQGPDTWWMMKDRATKHINELYGMGDDNIPVTQRIFGTEEAGLRPAFIQCVRCSNLLIQDVKIVDGPMWTIHPVYSNNIIVRGVDIATDPGPSTDGIAVDSSTNVLIENSTFRTGDDAIVLKSGRDKEGIRLHIPTENVIIRNNVIKEAHAGIAIGSEMSGDVRNVFGSDNTLLSVQFGFRVKATRGRGGIVENLWIQNMTIRNASIEAIQITTAYGLPFRKESTTLPLFRNIHLKNITTTKTRQAISIDGLPELPISDISFEDMTFSTRLGIELSNTDGITFKNTTLTLKDDDVLFDMTDSSNITIQTTLCGPKTPLCLLLKGEKSSNIDIHESSFSLEKKKIKTMLGANEESIRY